MTPAATRLGGIWAAALTPLDARLQPDTAAAAAYYRDVLARGCDGINLLGTTGEAMSLGLEQRLRLMEGVAAAGLPLERFMVGTGAASLQDAVQLTRVAFELGYAAALVLPPFFFRDATDDGIVRYYGELLARSHAPGKRVLLYNFPRMSGIAFHADLIDRLASEFPEAIAGVKDSSNEPALQREVVRRHPEFSVFAASENALCEARAYGAAGCISGSVALWPRVAAEAFHGGDAAAAARAAALRAALAGPPLIPAMRYLTARERNQERWELCLPPLVPLSEEERRALDGRLAEAYR
jgi:4-hydroxy-tetrahydrodipicolinate synthase